MTLVLWGGAAAYVGPEPEPEVYEFPALSDGVGLEISSFEETRTFDPTIRSRSVAGYLKTRPRASRVPSQFKGAYLPLTDTDRATLEEFEESVGVGSTSFTWTNPADDVEYTVRFKEPVRYMPIGTKNHWKAEMTLVEV
jgi:hypothetical protein